MKTSVTPSRRHILRNADKAALGNDGIRNNKLNAKKVGENTVIDNISIHSSSEESKERGVKPNKPNNKRGTGNTKMIPQENNLNGKFGIQNNQYNPSQQNNQDVRNQENTKRPYGNQPIRPNQIQSKPASFNDWRNRRNQNLNVDSSDDGLMVNGKKVTKMPGKRVKYNGDNGLPSSQSNASKSMTFNNSNNTGYATYNQGGVSINFINGAMLINGKKVPGLKANEEAVIEYGKGLLKVNGVRQAMFDGIQGSGRMIVLGDNFSHTVYDEDEDSRIGQGFTNLGNQNLNVDSSDGGLMVNGKKVTRMPGKRVKYNGDNGLPSSQSNAPKSMTLITVTIQVMQLITKVVLTLTL
ncbi:homeobox protein 2-like [Adelges cooleyi]|uniref:homeobox protein 2-like n=1 Tax=Adelges cooleyi TaxID=133065 RepID=UPI0021809499|nr:homeobox protein 2-like [Adelges cooleyi]